MITHWWCGGLCDYSVGKSQYYEVFRGPLADLNEFFKHNMELLGTE